MFAVVVWKSRRQISRFFREHSFKAPSGFPGGAFLSLQYPLFARALLLSPPLRVRLITYPRFVRTIVRLRLPASFLCQAPP
jgi:hypothetical protein